MQLINIFLKTEKFLLRNPVWNNSYGLARSIIAFGSLINLLFNDTYILFRPYAGLPEVPQCTYYNWFSIYCLLNDNLEIARYISILVLVVVVIGWRPRVTGILHWYITYSLATTATVIDGGDHIATILTFILLPICLTDTRKWHWQRYQIANSTDSNLILILSLIAFSSVVVLRLQMSVIYLHAAGAKLGVEEWQNGTAIYYWFLHPTFGGGDWLKPVITPLVQSRYGVTIITWSTILLEFLLFAGLIASERARKVLLIVGIAFHFSIILIHGLFSFFFSMCGGLILYLWPLRKSFYFINRNVKQSSK